MYHRNHPFYIDFRQVLRGDLVYFLKLKGWIHGQKMMRLLVEMI
ncbi:hypothetical protein MC28_E114 (plasmid) [Bacillus thuringiensis MC28]|nr:hypothetical protein MC28_E114 [Bacillus thuringiensis MC28]